MLLLHDSFMNFHFQIKYNNLFVWNNFHYIRACRRQISTQTSVIPRKAIHGWTTNRLHSFCPMTTQNRHLTEQRSHFPLTNDKFPSAGGPTWSFQAQTFVCGHLYWQWHWQLCSNNGSSLSNYQQFVQLTVEQNNGHLSRCGVVFWGNLCQTFR